MDRKSFYDMIRPSSFGLFNGKLSDSQVEGMDAILDAFVRHGDGREKSLAYILASAYHEVGRAMKPVRETFAKTDSEARENLAGKKYAKPVNGKSYYGRGFVQLTHDYNYEKFANRCNVDLVNNPDLALEPELGARILVEGIICGDFNASKKGIASYLTDSRDDLKNARRTVNVTDKWKTISGYYKKFLNAVQSAGGVPTTTSKESVMDDQQPASTSMEELITSIDPEENLSTEKILISNSGRRALPKYRPARKAAVSLATLKKYSHMIPEGHKDDSVFVIGVRGYYTDTMGKEGTNDRGIYDDAIFIIEPGKVYNFNGNTDPSRYRSGIASLKAPQVILYKPGKHGISGPNPYPAFRQASVCTVIRDKSGEDTDTDNKRFWINLHRGGVQSTSSAGCQTVPPHQWNEFKTLLDQLLEEHGQKTFCYLLVDEKDVPKEEEVLEEARKRKGVLVEESGLEEKSDMNTTLLLLARALLKHRKGSLDELPADDRDTETRKLLNELLLRLIDEDSPLTDGLKDKRLPIKNAFGTAIGGLLDGKKTGIGIIGVLATILLPIIFPENGKEIVEAFDIGGSNNAGNLENGRTVLGSIFGSIGVWGILGKIEKWIHLVKG